MGISNKYFLLNEDLIDVKYFEEDKIFQGKNLYEVIKVKEGVPLFYEKHIERLHNSAKLTNLQPWISDSYIKEGLKKLIEANEVEQGSLKFLLNFDKKSFLAFFEENNFPTEIQYEEGVAAALYHRERVNPNAKVLNAEFRKDLDKFIKEKNIFEAILVDRNEDITEGSKSNVFVIKDEKVITTPVKAVLPGTTRSTILEICKEENIELIEKKLYYKEIENIEGMFISSTPFDILPIKNIDEINLASADNKVIITIMNAYRNKIKEYIKKDLNKQ